jgi:hypothetical protein
MAEDSKPPAKAEPQRCPHCQTMLLPAGSDGLIPCNHCRSWYRMSNGRLTETTVGPVAFTAIPRPHSNEKPADFPEGAA